MKWREEGKVHLKSSRIPHYLQRAVVEGGGARDGLGYALQAVRDSELSSDKFCLLPHSDVGTAETFVKSSV